MATYVALTTHNFQQNGYHEVARGSNKAEVLQAARQKIGDVATGYGTDIYASTYHKNLLVVSLSQARRKGWLKRND